MTTEEFIEKSKLIYGNDLFGYEECEYINTQTHIKLKCETHGYFNQPQEII